MMSNDKMSQEAFDIMVEQEAKAIQEFNEGYEAAQAEREKAAIWGALSAEEQSMLHDLGINERVIDVVNFGNPDVKRSLENKKLIGRSFQHVWILDLGRAVLAQAEPPAKAQQKSYSFG
jgi:hypothetical protein